MLPVIVLGENEPRMQHIGRSLPITECIPLQSLKIQNNAAVVSLPSLREPSIILLDMEADGLTELESYIKRLKMVYYESIVLVLLPFGESHGEQIALEAGADDILLRPVSINRLSLTIRNLSELLNRRIAMQKASNSRANMHEDQLKHYISLMSQEGALKRLHHVEQEIIQYAVSYCHGHISQAARALGIGRSTLYRKMDAIETRLKFQQRMQKTADRISVVM